MTSQTPFWPEEFARRYRKAGHWTGEVLGAALTRHARDRADAVAVTDGSTRLTYAQLADEVAVLAARFLSLGLRRGDHVVVQLPNTTSLVVSSIAMFELGIVPVFALPAHRASEISHLCTSADAAAYLVPWRHGGFDYLALAAEVRTRIAGPDLILVDTDADAELPGWATSLAGTVASSPQTAPHRSAAHSSASHTAAPHRSASHTAAPHDPEAPGTGPSPGDTALMLLSGGTTGLPKLIPRTHDDYLYAARAGARICRFDEHTVYLTALPAGHNFPMGAPGWMGTLDAGGRVVLTSDTKPERLFALMAAERVTATALVPPAAISWLDAEGAPPPCLELLQVGGARLLPEAARRIVAEFSCTLQQVFGMAEGLVNYTRLDDPLDVIVETQGRPCSPDDELLVLDDDGHEAADGATGHLLTRGPYTIRGYHNADAHNAESFTPDGFYRTGDLVRLTAGGNLVVEGRTKDQINRGGEKIAVDEVEDHLLAHPAVQDAVMVAVPDAYLGERSCAFVVARGEAPRASTIKRFLVGRGIAAYKIPDRIEFLDAFPHTGVGKISRRDLRTLLAARLAAPAEGGAPDGEGAA